MSSLYRLASCVLLGLSYKVPRPLIGQHCFFLTTILGESRGRRSRFSPSWKRLAAFTDSLRRLEQNAPENTVGKIEKRIRQGCVSSHTERARGGRK